MLGWLKKHYSQVAQKNWYSCELNDEQMLRPCSKEVKHQLKEEKKSKLDKVIHDLGLIEGKDENDKIILKNNIPIRRQITLKQTGKLIKKLNTNKPNSLPYSISNHSKSENSDVKKIEAKQNMKSQQNQQNQQKQTRIQVIKGNRPFHLL